MVGHAGSPTHIVHVDMTLTRSKVKVTALLKFRKLQFSRSISSAILAWSSKLMVDRDSTGPSLQLIGAQFLNFLLRKLSRELKLRGMLILHMVRHASSPICIAHTDVTLTRSKVKVTDLLKFRKLHFSISTSSTILAWRSQLMDDYDSTGPSIQFFGARFLNFSPIWWSRDFEFREMVISPESTAFYLHTGWG